MSTSAKIFALYLLLFLTFKLCYSYPVTIKIKHPCKSHWLVDTLSEVDSKKKSVGELTLSLLQKNNIEYVGNQFGFKSIHSTPYDYDSFDIINDRELRQFGWCYMINDTLPTTPVHEYTHLEAKDTIYWYWGFAYYNSGNWLSYCVPAETLKFPALGCPGYIETEKRLSTH